MPNATTNQNQALNDLASQALVITYNANIGFIQRNDEIYSLAKSLYGCSDHYHRAVKTQESGFITSLCHATLAQFEKIQDIFDNDQNLIDESKNDDHFICSIVDGTIIEGYDQIIDCEYFHILNLLTLAAPKIEQLKQTDPENSTYAAMLAYCNSCIRLIGLLITDMQQKRLAVQQQYPALFKV